MKTKSAALLVGLSLFTFATALTLTAAPRPLVPEIASDWWRICTMPDLGALNGPDAKKQQIVDHSFIQRPDGKWTLWACMRGTGPGRILYGWEGDSLEKGPWAPLGIVARATQTWGENAGGGANLESGTVPPANHPKGERIGPPEVIQAPHFARLGDTFHCFYNTNGVRLMTSRDGKNFTRVGTPPNGNLLYADGGRDVMVLPIDGVFHAYSTISTQDKRGYIILRTSRDLKTWTPAINICEGGKGGVGAVSAESPFVVFREGFYYLFRASSNDGKTYIYRSRTPDYFGVNDDTNLIATMKVKAPEIIEHGGEWFISDLADFQGLKVAKLKWTAAAP